MINFIEEHFEGIIALIIGLIIPSIVFFFSLFQRQTLQIAETTLNKTSQRLDNRINKLEDSVLILEQNIKHLENLIDSLPDKYLQLQIEIEKLKK